MDEKRELFFRMDRRLLEDERPSRYFRNLGSPLLEEHPFAMLSRLKEVMQSPKYHPEGNVWEHTLLVLDEAAVRKGQASDSRVFMWAALLHDIGKITTTKVRKGKITAYGHDKAGAELALEFFRSFEEEPFAAQVAALVRWHMQILYAERGMPFTDLEAMCRETDVRDVALLGLCDRLGRLGTNQNAEKRTVLEFLRKVRARQDVK